MGEGLDLAGKLGALLQNGWGAVGMLVGLCVYLFRELRKSDAARLSDSREQNESLARQNEVLKRVTEVMERVESKSRTRP